MNKTTGKEDVALIAMGVGIGLLVFMVLMVIGVVCPCPAHGYDIEATFDAVPSADGYLVHVGETVTAVAPGGDPYVTTTVYVEATRGDEVSAPSNTIEIPPLLTECERMDLDGDGIVTASDLLSLWLTVTEGMCDE